MKLVGCARTHPVSRGKGAANASGPCTLFRVFSCCTGAQGPGAGQSGRLSQHGAQPAVSRRRRQRRRRASLACDVSPPGPGPAGPSISLKIPRRPAMRRLACERAGSYTLLCRSHEPALRRSRERDRVGSVGRERRMRSCVGSSPPRGPHRLRQVTPGRSRWLIRLFDRLFHILLRIWAVGIGGGLAVSALAVLVEDGVSGLPNPGLYPLVYVFLLLVYLNPVTTLATIGALLVVTVLGTVAHQRGHVQKLQKQVWLGD
jgi:hypothetical protein